MKKYFILAILCLSLFQIKSQSLNVAIADLVGNFGAADVCSGSDVFLKPVVTGGSGSYSYSWLDPGSFVISTASTLYLSAPVTPGTYTLNVTDNNSPFATGSGTFVINNVVVTPPSISVSPSTSGCPGEALTLLPSLPAPNIIGPGVGWYNSNFTFLNNSFALNTIYPDQSTTYSFYFNTAVCDGLISSTVSSNAPICSLTPLLQGNITMTANFNNTTRTIDGTLTIPTAASRFISKSEIQLTGKSRIVVSSGATLTITQSWLHGCGCMWKGIEVEPGGVLNIINVSIIEDARKAIQCKTPLGVLVSGFNLNRAVINKCDTGIYIPGSTVNLNPSMSIRNSIITCRAINSAALRGSFLTYANARTQWLYDGFLSTGYAGNIPPNINSLYPTTTMINGNRSRVGIFVKDYNVNDLNIILTTGTGINDRTIFDNLDIGFSGFNADVYIQNSQFSNMCGYVGKTPIGVGIYMINDFSNNIDNRCTSSGNSFINLLQGIHTENYAYLHSNTSDMLSEKTDSGPYNTPGICKTGQYGIYYDYAKRSQQQVNSELFVHGNIINGFDIGTQINRNQFYGITNYQFLCNTYSGTLPQFPSQFMRIGIFMNDGVGSPNIPFPPFNITFEGNDIVYCQKNAIFLQNVRQAVEIKSNGKGYNWPQSGGGIVPFQGLNVKNSGAGEAIRLENCANVQLFNNGNIGGENLLPYTTKGIDFINSNFCTVLQNGISYNESDIYLDGPGCFPLNLKANNLFDATYGITWANDAQIGPQGTPTSPWFNRFISTTWQTNVTNQTFNPNSVSTDRIYYRNTGIQNMPNAIQTYNSPAPLPNYALTNTGGILSPTTLGNYIPTAPPLPCVSPQPIAPPTNFNVTLQNISNLKVWVNDSLNGQNNRIEKWWQKQYFAYEELMRDSAYYSTDTILNQYLSSTLNSGIGNFYQVKELAASGLWQQAINLNSQQGITCLPEDYRKQINAISIPLVYDSTFVLDSTKFLLLNAIANTCPEQGGQAVYEARTILMQIQKSYIQFNDSCLTTPNLRFANFMPLNHSGEEKLFVVYPNPNNGIVNVKQSTGKAIQAYVHVFAISGQLISTQILNSGGDTTLNLNDKGIQPGMYLLIVKDSVGRILFKDKFIIQN